ncbi:hypothetical protein [Modestobacter sp. SYSU DS0657]
MIVVVVALLWLLIATGLLFALGSAGRAGRLEDEARGYVHSRSGPLGSDPRVPGLNGPHRVA